MLNRAILLTTKSNQTNDYGVLIAEALFIVGADTSAAKPYYGYLQGSLGAAIPITGEMPFVAIVDYPEGSIYGENMTFVVIGIGDLGFEPGQVLTFVNKATGAVVSVTYKAPDAYGYVYLASEGLLFEGIGANGTCVISLYTAE